MPARRTVPVWVPATAVLTLLLGVMAGVLASPASADEPRLHTRPAGRSASTPQDPLGVTIESLTPSTIKADPTKGTVSVSGTVTNHDDATWDDLNVYAFIGSTPLTTETELTEASLSDPSQSAGYNRVTSYGDFTTIPSLAPGASATFSLVIPRADLHGPDQAAVTQPGVYWFGIQVLGTSPTGRTGLANGRARTFLPLVGPEAKTLAPVRASLVVPLRQRVLRQPDGTLAAPENWLKRLSPGGRLAELLALAETRPTSWLVDPAVLDAVAQLAAGNPPRSIAATDGSGGTATSPSAAPNAVKRAATSPARGSSEPSDLAAVAKDWLGRMLTALRASTAVYALPYGDLDLAAAARHDPALYAVARQRSAEALTALGIDGSYPVDAPADGYLQPGAIGQGADSTQLILSDQAISGTVPPVADVDGRSVITASSLVASGGPPPGDQLGLVPVRQELLAQASMRLQTGDPLVAVLPANWAPHADAVSSADFFAGLTPRWLQLTSIAGATGTSAPQEVSASRLRYPDAEYQAELPAQTFGAVNGLRTAGRLLQDLLPHNDTVATAVLDDALTSASYTARGGSGGAAAERSRAAIEAQLRKVTLETPPAVTLSSDHGRFNATVINGLDQPISVRVRALADNGMVISVPRRLDLPPKGHVGVLLTAKARTNGVHAVTLELTDRHGDPLGSQASFRIRTAQVSRIIWVFIVCGIGLLFTAIVVRLVRRLRGRGPGGGTGGEADGEAGGVAGVDPGRDPSDSLPTEPTEPAERR